MLRAALLDDRWPGLEIYLGPNDVGNVVDVDVIPHIGSAYSCCPAPDRDDSGRMARGSIGYPRFFPIQCIVG